MSKSIKSTILPILLALKATGISGAVQASPYQNVDSMLQAARPSACAAGSELCTLVQDLDPLRQYEPLRSNALLTLIPVADGSLRAASEGTMRQMMSVLNDRLRHVKYTRPLESSAAELSPPSDPAKKEEKKAEHKDEKLKTEAKTEAKTEPKTEAKTEPKTAPEKKLEKTSGKIHEKKLEKSGISSGDPEENHHRGAWIQFLGQEARQNVRDDIPGYAAEVLGAIVGRDFLVSPNAIFGIAGGYQHAHVNSKGPSGSYLDIKRLHATFYGSYDFSRPYYIHWSATVADLQYDNKRHIFVPLLQDTHVPFVRIAQADFDGWEANATLETGYVYRCGHLEFIPKIMLLYSHLETDNYYENDAFDLNLSVKYENIDNLPLGAGFKLQYINEFEKAYVIPEMHAYAFYDFLRDPQTATASMLGGGFDFLSEGVRPAPAGIEVGVGFAVHSYQNTAVIIQYDYAAREDYHSHQAFIKVRHEW